ncbi:extracellular solute-binding protein family 1 [Thermaerobacter marianensis DSM 12885]|uniref:Extracellular solute-binding protein family 1 n=1 Tax=Thermaerobacter marianensis (strain ATCC 700841 / DSM 12885 / JCM 10246 / 7p75a) TaxID=644966 RepID=E6SGY5_THEM7|nr:iron ABC transporter substrate-binding protein [Thermaerobacter marianensis]ADU50616.1 extracellular solute-binding protein family 1 [Thermaerobacter marianensis DSM 12885]
MVEPAPRADRSGGPEGSRRPRQRALRPWLRARGGWQRALRRPRGALRLVAVLALAGFVLSGCGVLGRSGRQELVVYSSRTQSLVHPLLEQFARETGIDIKVRYASTAELVNTLLEEGERSAADVLYLADAGGWGPLRQAGLLAELPQDVLEKVDPRFRSPDGQWVGVSGRSKVIVYNKNKIDPGRDLPDSVMDLTDPKWKGRIGWAPTHGEWQILVTAIRLTKGEDAARQWLEGMKANDPKEYPNLISIVRAVADGEVDIGVVNHYYVPRLMEELGPDFAARNYFLKNGDPGAVIDVTGAAILKSTKNREAAERFVRFLLSEEAQRYFTQETKEYPMIAGIPLPAGLPPMEELDPPAIDQSDLGQLQQTVELLRETGVLP